MKVCVVQPKYSFWENDIDVGTENLCKMLDECDKSLDLIVLPEYSDALADIKGKDGIYFAFENNNKKILDKAKATAKRCSSLLFVNAGYKTEKGIRNTTYFINREGEIIDTYFKSHPAPSETKKDSEGGHEFDVDYSYEYSKPHIIEYEGVRFAYLTCYDFYFYENFARIARENVDIIIGCSLQRTDTHQAISIINKFLCYNTNAYLVRSSVSLYEDSKSCGCSMVVDPRGEILLNMGNKIGITTCQINPRNKYLKPAGYLGQEKAHYEYIEEGRRPWLYRNAGPGVVVYDRLMKYPRLCAHRGFSAVAPENSMPAFGAAIALGVEEIELDLWSTKDGVIVSSHDSTLERVSDGIGEISEYTYNELLKFDFGVKFGYSFKGLKIPTFEDILKKFGGRVIMNIHVKIWDNFLPDLKIKEIVDLVREYDCDNYVYFMTTNDEAIKKLKKYAPDMKVCVGWDGNKDPMSIVNRAIALDAYKVQFFKPYYSKEAIDKAHAHGILCNVYWSDNPEEAIQFFKLGMDCILTNEYLSIHNATKEFFLKK